MSVNPAVLGLSTSAPCFSDSKEPITTPTIAGIYLRQGLPHRALKVYRDMLLSDPHNDGLRLQLEELEARLRAEEEQMHQGVESPAQESTSSDPPTTVAQREVAFLTSWLEAVRRRKRHVL